MWLESQFIVCFMDLLNTVPQDSQWSSGDSWSQYIKATPESCKKFDLITKQYASRAHCKLGMESSGNVPHPWCLSISQRSTKTSWWHECKRDELWAPKKNYSSTFSRSVTLPQKCVCSALKLEPEACPTSFDSKPVHCTIYHRRTVHKTIKTKHLKTKKQTKVHQAIQYEWITALFFVVLCDYEIETKLTQA